MFAITAKQIINLFYQLGYTAKYIHLGLLIYLSYNIVNLETIRNELLRNRCTTCSNTTSHAETLGSVTPKDNGGDTSAGGNCSKSGASSSITGNSESVATSLADSISQEASKSG